MLQAAAGLARLQAFADQCSAREGAERITSSDVKEVIALLSSKTALQVVRIFRDVAWQGGSSGPGCEVLLEAGAIPVLYSVLAWHVVRRDRDIVAVAGCAFYWLADGGTAAVRAAMREAPAAAAILEMAEATRWDIGWDGSFSRAALDSINN